MSYLFYTKGVRRKGTGNLHKVWDFMTEVGPFLSISSTTFNSSIPHAVTLLATFHLYLQSIFSYVIYSIGATESSITVPSFTVFRTSISCLTPSVFLLDIKFWKSFILFLKMEISKFVCNNISSMTWKLVCVVIMYVCWFWGVCWQNIYNFGKF